MKAAVVGRGIESPRVTSKGIKSSINSSSGGSVKGEKSGYANDCRSLVWCSKCEESAEWAVISLE